MLLNRLTLITALSILMCSGCVSIKNEQQQLQITNLQTELNSTQQFNQQIQSELASANINLQSCQESSTQVNQRLKKCKQAEKRLNKTVKLADKTIFGRLEWIYISTTKSNYKARIDTGAATSSINATKIERFERDGKKWVRFDLNRADGLDPQTVEAKIERFVKILQSNDPDTTTSRPVIRLNVRIGDIIHKTEFTLTDRSHMLYPVLIGRSFLQDVVLVDVSKKYIHRKYTAK